MKWFERYRLIHKDFEMVMQTFCETILPALPAQLTALPSTAQRGDVLPERVPASGLLILRDGEPGEPEVTLSPLRYHSQHWRGDCC